VSCHYTGQQQFPHPSGTAAGTRHTEGWFPIDGEATPDEPSQTPFIDTAADQVSHQAMASLGQPGRRVTQDHCDAKHPQAHRRESVALPT
jgi:hypothetical protein